MRNSGVRLHSCMPFFTSASCQHASHDHALTAKALKSASTMAVLCRSNPDRSWKWLHEETYPMPWAAGTIKGGMWTRPMRPPRRFFSVHRYISARKPIMHLKTRNRGVRISEGLLVYLPEGVGDCTWQLFKALSARKKASVIQNKSQSAKLVCSESMGVRILSLKQKTAHLQSKLFCSLVSYLPRPYLSDHSCLSSHCWQWRIFSAALVIGATTAVFVQVVHLLPQLNSTVTIVEKVWNRCRDLSLTIPHTSLIGTIDPCFLAIMLITL